MPVPFFSFFLSQVRGVHPVSIIPQSCLFVPPSSRVTIGIADTALRDRYTAGIEHDHLPEGRVFIGLNHVSGGIGYGRDAVMPVLDKVIAIKLAVNISQFSPLKGEDGFKRIWKPRPVGGVILLTIVIGMITIDFNYLRGGNNLCS